MKLSVKLQDDQNQSSLIKAKVPVSIFNQPFTSSLATTTFAAAPQGLSFSLATDFPSGPSLKLSYSPSASTTRTAPFSLSLKSGLGLFGSPNHSPLVFSAHFSLSPSNPSVIIPTFLLHFRPKLGDFALHKSTSSNPNPEPKHSSSFSPGAHLNSGSPLNFEFGNGFVSEEPSGWQELKLEPCNGNGNGFGNPNSSNVSGLHSGIGIGLQEKPLGLKEGKRGGFLNGIAITARTILPVTKRIALNLRWGLNLPTDLGAKLPYLTVNKIAIERVEEFIEVKRESNENDVKDLELLKGMCFWMRRDLEVLEKENREMKQSLEEMKLGFSGRNLRRESDGVVKKVSRPSVESSGEFERWRSKKNSEEGNERREMKKTLNPMNDVESELQKAIKAATS